MVPPLKKARNTAEKNKTRNRDSLLTAAKKYNENTSDICCLILFNEKHPEKENIIPKENSAGYEKLKIIFFKIENNEKMKIVESEKIWVIEENRKYAEKISAIEKQVDKLKQ